MTVLSTLQSYFSFLTGKLRGAGLDVDIQPQWSILYGTAVAYAIYKYLSRPKNLPPGPKGQPFIGAIMDLTSNLHTDCINFSQQYKSDIVSFYIGRQLQVVLNSADAIKMAFMHTDDFSHRDPSLAEWTDLHDKLFVASFSAEWKQIKSFCITSMKAHGFSNVKLEESTKLQCARMICHLECLPNNTIGSDDIKTLIAKAGACIITKILASRDYAFDDPELDDVVITARNILASFFENIPVWSFYGNMFPSVLLWFVKKHHIRGLQSKVAEMRSYFLVWLEEHKETVDVDNPRDVMDDILIHQKTLGMTDREVVDTLQSFTPDPIESVSNQVTWILYFVCYYPEVQNKILKEIHSVCGDNVPGLKDRSNMPYCEAVIMESMRISSLFAFTVSHRNDEDTELGGYFIPKDTILQGNLYAVHYDERTFPEPTKFKPDRFLTSQGKLTNVDKVMLFGTGRRKCTGEPLVRCGAFVYVTGLVQKFELSFPEDHEPAPFKFDDIDRLSPAHKMKFIARY